MHFTDQEMKQIAYRNISTMLGLYAEMDKKES